MIKKVEIASVNTGKLPVLSNKEKNELLIKIKEGDKEAREKFISRKLKISFKCNTKASEYLEKMHMTYFK